MRTWPFSRVSYISLTTARRQDPNLRNAATSRIFSGYVGCPTDYLNLAHIKFAALFHSSSVTLGQSDSFLLQPFSTPQ